ncbi:hypothetical protein P9239_10850 [Caballeronia sp. LZ062]|uniref:hypothetical protein n=1 Tax=unclassified Caballeronia TaxID=2646786 RepID=UPI0028638EF8|nr:MULTISPECIES: hypothetical protein [unclassified Caballeronia]MDR5854629.1 hypothetical protein [Caballeronia sp. LZ050]MDR5870843.1 hypothetical protein [Caballeronia sp. LZ062]
MKQAKDEPRSAPQAPQGGETDERAKPPLPHETDQSVQSQDEEAPRDVGRQAHEDLERGLVDTDRQRGPTE